FLSRVSVKITEDMIQLSYVVTIISITLLCVLAEELYSDKHDNIDVIGILQNDKLRNQLEFYAYYELKPKYGNLILGIVGEVFQTKCKKCTEKQKELILTVKNWYVQNEPEQWESLIAKTIEYGKKYAEKSTRRARQE
ncbi:PEB3 protein, partial [Acromyrmex charruanus]